MADPASGVVEPAGPGDAAPSIQIEHAADAAAPATQPAPDKTSGHAPYDDSLAPIKPEFRVENQVQPTDAPPAGSAATPVVPNKSRTQDKKDRSQAKSMGVCNNFALGKCFFGDKCKFNHDIEAFLKTKAADLPGTCPFYSTNACPFGITCRYARSHSFTDELHDRMRRSADADAAAAASNTEDSPAPSSASVETVELPTPSSLEATLNIMDKPLQSLLWKNSSAAVVTVELTTPSSLEATLNIMDKPLQSLLWKNRYDFSRADAVLKDMGVRVTFRAPKPMKERGKKEAADVQPPLKKARTDEAKAEEAKPDEAMAVEAKAEEAKPDEAMAVEGKAEEGKPDEAMAVEGKAEEAKPDEVMAVEGKAEEAKPESGNTTGSVPTAEMLKENRQAHVESVLKPGEKKIFDFRGKTYLAPLTTVGNLPFRRVCKGLGVDITCGEMALATNLLQGQASEWALMKRHPCEDLFGVQVCGGFADALARTAQLIDENLEVDFVDVNMGCPIDIVCNKSAGSSLLLKPNRIEEIARAMSRNLSCPLTLKTRRGYYNDKDITHTFISKVRSWGPVALTLHGRTREQRYTKKADWSYISKCAELAAEESGLQLIGNGDIASCMIGRSALIKPRVLTEIKEQRHWDISSGERLDILKRFCSHGLEHWGADSRGVENTRRFLLEWLSYTCRYIPVGVLERVPQQMHWRPSPFVGRNDLETLMSSDGAQDWVKISEMLLGPVPAGFTFSPKHKSNAYVAPSGQGRAGGSTGTADDEQCNG
eukprot:gene1745-33155_t